MARIRRSVELWDRCRIVFVLMSIALLGSAAWIFAKGIRLLVGVVPGNGGLPLLGFVTGAVLGIVAGQIIHGTVNVLVMGLAGFRTERLLLQYHDEFCGSGQGPIEIPDDARRATVWLRN